MPFGSTTYTAAAAQTDFVVDFPYVLQGYVTVEVDGSPATFTWPDDTTIRLDTPCVGGETVQLIRTTPIDDASRITDFVDGGVITENSLDLQFDQMLHALQEGIDSIVSGITLDGGEWDAQGFRIKNLADGVSADDAVAFNQIDTAVTQAEAAQTAAELAETNAQASETAAAASAASAAADLATFQGDYPTSFTGTTKELLRVNDAATAVEQSGVGFNISPTGSDEDKALLIDASGDIKLSSVSFHAPDFVTAWVTPSFNWGTYEQLIYVTHGLGATPSLYKVFMRLKPGFTDGGWSGNDGWEFESNTGAEPAGTHAFFCAVNATHVRLNKGGYQPYLVLYAGTGRELMDDPSTEYEVQVRLWK